MAAVISMPKSDPALLAFSLNFSTKITATPTAYNLTSALASAYATVHANFASALAACDPAIRSKPATATKNSARATLRDQLLLLALQVQAGPSVTDAQKIELGLTVAAARTPHPVPTALASVDVVSVAGRTVKIRIHDSTGEGKRFKPPGATGAAVCTYIGAAAPTDPSAYRWQGNTTRSIIDIPFADDLPPGTVVWITAMYFNERQQTGPACTPISAILGYGMSAVA